MDLLIAIVLGLALGVLTPYVVRNVIPRIAHIVLVFAAIWYVIDTLDVIAGSAFAAAIVASSATLTRLLERHPMSETQTDA